MSADILKAELLKDTTSTTALAIFNLNPGTWSTSSQVPRYLYTCLADLVSGTGLLPNLVVSDYGLATTPASQAIIIQPSQTIEAAINLDEYISPDIDGGEKTLISVLVKNVRTSTDFYLTRDIGLRIRYILDSGLRGLTNNQFMLANNPTSLDPSVLADNSINPNYPLKAIWIRSLIPHVNEQQHDFRIAYQRMFI